MTNWPNKIVLDMSRDGSGSVCLGILNPGNACTIRKQNGEYHLKVIPLSDAETKESGYERGMALLRENVMTAKDAVVRERERVKEIIQFVRALYDFDGTTQKGYNHSRQRQHFWACDEIERRIGEEK